MEQLKLIIQKFGTRNISDVYNASKLFVAKYVKVYSKLNEVSKNLKETNYTQYSGLYQLIKDYIIKSDLIFDSQFKSQSELRELESRLNRIETFLDQEK